MLRHSNCLNPQVHTPPFAATVAVPLQLYQEDPVHQSLGLTLNFSQLHCCSFLLHALIFTVLHLFTALFHTDHSLLFRTNAVFESEHSL